MAKNKPKERWKNEPEEHDFPAAADYLSLIFRDAEVEEMVGQLRGTETIPRKVKDLLRASRLELLPAADPEVRRDLEKVAVGERLSPVLLVRRRGHALIVADSYHRLCASYHLEEDAEVPCRLVDAP